MNNLGNNIRAARTKQKLTQEKLAELSGLSLNFISRLERTNTNNVSVKNLIKIAEALGVSTTQLLSDQEQVDNGYASVERLDYLLRNLPEEIANDYAEAFAQILRVNNR